MISLLAALSFFAFATPSFAAEVSPRSLGYWEPGDGGGGATAILTIFASSSGSSSVSTAGHAFISVTNYTGSNITVGKLSGVGPFKTVTVGTWDDSVNSEHEGVWYNAEAYWVNRSAYTDRVSLSVGIDSSQLTTLSNYIKNNDYWSIFSNCSTFAAGAWNSVVDSSIKLSPGVFDTPTNLKSSINSNGAHQNGLSVTFDYPVYYAQGTGTLKLSTVFN